MSSASYHGVVRGGVVVLREPGPLLMEGTEVVVTPVADPCGSPAAVLAAADAAPQVPAIWVDEFEQLIAQGRRPPARPDPFWDEPESP